MQQRQRRVFSGLLVSGLCVASLAASGPAHAAPLGELAHALVEHARSFCGFYVAGADAKLFNDATVVVLMRDGTRTVIAMQNSYQGPPEQFALVVPVPVVLQADDVTTLRPELFERVDKLAAPRLVEYWEQDPCAPDNLGGFGMVGTGRGGGGSGEGGIGLGFGGKVKVEAQFEVEEYEIVILSATESTALDAWLRENDYAIPAGAEPLLRPYVQQDMKFFVAKVDPKKVKFDAQGRAMLAPLRFHYESKEFSLPVRLGLINAPDPASGGKQDLLVHILAPGTRYQVANYPNVTIPTNLDLVDKAKDEFGQFYVSLFDHTISTVPPNPAGAGAVVTEYAWAAGTCDPCPNDPLTSKELLELGGNVLPKWSQQLKNEGGVGGWGSVAGEFVLTRLHARYDQSSLGEDLVFEAAEPLVGGREWPKDETGQPEQGARVVPGQSNNFQARYAIRHPWTGEIACKDPVRKRWGGPPNDADLAGLGGGRPSVATQLATVGRGASLGSFVTAESASQLGVVMLADVPAATTPSTPAAGVQPPPATTPQPTPVATAPQAPSAGSCTCTSDASGSPPWSLLGLALLGLLRPRRRSA